MDSEKFRRKFRDQCQTPQFRTEVKSIIRDETFFKDLVRDLTSHQQVASQVNEELKIKLPSEVERVATPIVESKLNLFTYHKLPQLTALQINSQLSNHVQMNNMFSQHSANLEAKLEAKSNEVMTKVVNEPKYHTLSNLHFVEITRKNDSKMSDIETNLNRRFDNEIRPSINEFKILQTKFNYLERRHDFIITGCIILAIMGFGGWGGWHYMKNNNKGKRV